MRKIRLFFRAALLLMREGSTWNNADLQWTEQDALSLGHFLGNSAGKRLAARLRFASLEHNRTAVQDGKKHRCGIATGYMMAVNDIQLLATGAIDSHAQAEVDNVVDMQSTGTLGHLSP